MSVSMFRLVAFGSVAGRARSGDDGPRPNSQVEAFDAQEFIWGLWGMAEPYLAFIGFILSALIVAIIVMAVLGLDGPARPARRVIQGSWPPNV